MIELLVTCYLTGIFTPPPGWTILEIFANDPNERTINMTLLYCEGGPCPLPKPYVKLTRIMQPGEVVELPARCNAVSKITQ